MAAPPFYNSNANRAYPFVYGTSFVPDATIVACGFMLGPLSGFDASVDDVALVEVSRVADTLSFKFACTAPGLASRDIVFTRDVSDPPYSCSYTDDGENPTKPAINGCGVADGMQGYLVTGDLTPVIDALTQAGVSLTGNAVVEPCLLIDMSQAYVTAVHLANGDRTRYETPAGCRNQCWPFTPSPLYVRAACLTGAVRFVEGYNVAIRQSLSGSSITFDAVIGGGDGEPCSQVPLFPGELPPDDSVLLDGGPGCGEVFRSINGQGGRVMSIEGDLGVSVSSRPDSHKIVVDVTTNGLAVCGPGGGGGAEPDCPDIPPSSDECDCGEA